MNADQLAQSSLGYQRLTAQLLAKQQATSLKQYKTSQGRWHMLIIAVLFWYISKRIVLQQQFKPVFDIFKTASDDESQQGCKIQNADAWNIVWNVAYPWIGMFHEQPLNREQARFLWYSILNNSIPKADQIADEQAKPGCKWAGVSIVPLAYMCGNLSAMWAEVSFNGDSTKVMDAVIADPANTPWTFYLTKNSTILTDGVANGMLDALLTKGLWGAALWNSSDATSPKDMYTAIFGTRAPPSGCNIPGKIGSVSSTMATFSMAGSAFTESGPTGAAVGAVIGLAMGLIPNKNDPCNITGGGCSIM